MRASQVIRLLEAKHHKDVFVPECKTGSTHMSSHRRLDAWAMACSWAHPTTWGYEVKVSRSDFLNDRKWPDYLPYRNEFSFVCPHGLIRPEELPDEAGLLWVTKNGARLFTKKKAPHRQVEIPDGIWRYVLMWRAGKDPEEESEKRRLDRWRAWLASKEKKRELGYLLRGEISKTLLMIHYEVAELRAQAATVNAFREKLKEHGLDPDASQWRIESLFTGEQKRRARLLLRQALQALEEE